MKVNFAAIAITAVVGTTPAFAGIETISDGIPAANSSLKVGVGVANSSNAYRGYDDRQSAIPLIQYDSENFYMDGLEIGYKAWEEQNHRVSLFLGAGGEEFDASKSNHLKSFDDRDMSIMAGTRYRYMDSWGILDAKIAFDVSDKSDGTVASIGYGYPIQVSDRLTIMPRGFAKWMNNDYANYYYGVSDNEAQSIGASAYAPGSSYKYGVELAGAYRINNAWELSAGARLQMLDSNIKDSPMISGDNETVIFTGVSYKFW
ncbi:MipA/OmpV family protein [Corallincola spongiicola]|uniref:MipA/OmpV family protein n=1 Tax=Corallincola spongiicola TaxID=2520508 RepID=A0ABY1WUV0_9GAMM|nr:MipA/OmpV family protein [Corallincola spongiicola]TAA48351.1 MipA/OmpV family protein [Corallincola spongiicola]